MGVVAWMTVKCELAVDSCGQSLSSRSHNIMPAVRIRVATLNKSVSQVLKSATLVGDGNPGCPPRLHAS